MDVDGSQWSICELTICLGVPQNGWSTVEHVEHPIYKWMMTGGTPILDFRKPPYGLTLSLPF